MSRTDFRIQRYQQEEKLKIEGAIWFGGGVGETEGLNYFALKLIEGTEKRVGDRLIADSFLRLTFHRVQRMALLRGEGRRR